MRSTIALGAAALAAIALTSCGGGSPGARIDNSTAPGTLIESPPIRVASLNAADLTAQLTASAQGQALVQLAGTPTCGVDFHYFHYQTVGGKNEPTTASGAIMAPTGGTGCSGARPILVYTHGTAVTKTYNIANITDSTNEAWQEGAMIGAFFAAHGYIVVASNYAGYDSSPLPYHPYLNADQQSQDVINALAAARTALTNGLPSGDTDNGKLFITGYSQGGHVAMATHRAMEAKGMTVTAAAPMSGPYAMLAFGDAAIAYSSPGLGGTIYYPMIVNSYQQSYGNVYKAPTD
ncbi:MAG TPA: alpha/beta hydrolase, partial [Burkholderiaceae bacterium]